MDKMEEIKTRTDELIKRLNLPVKLRIEYNGRYSRVIASVLRIEQGLYRLSISDTYLKLDKRIQDKILKHEIAHIYDRIINKRKSKHDKIFKDLCEGLYGDRIIGQATIKNF